MRRALLILVVLVFSLGLMASTNAAPGAAPDRHPCVRRCHEEFNEARRACRHLPPAEQRECERRARERLEHCLRNCR